jgi:hypothetical protein
MRTQAVAHASHEGRLAPPWGERGRKHRVSRARRQGVERLPASRGSSMRAQAGVLLLCQGNSAVRLGYRSGGCDLVEGNEEVELLEDGQGRGPYRGDVGPGCTVEMRGSIVP